MIDYDEEWLVKLVCRKEGSVAIRASLYALPSAVLAVLFLAVEDWWPNIRETSGIKDASESQLWSAVTAVIVLLLGFRTKQALARFWEGTGLLHMMRGEWYDSVSCLITFSRAAKLDKPEEVMAFRHTLVRIMSLCHGSALQEIKDQDSVTEQIVTLDVGGLDPETLHHLMECKEKYHFNRVEVLLHLTQTLVIKALDDGVLRVAPPILSRVYQTLSRGFVNLLNAKKICDTRFPFPYAQLITLLLFAHMVLTPILLTNVITTKALAALITYFVIFGMFALNFAASELENPFGSDDNDLPLEHFQNEMNNSLMMLLHENTDHVPTIRPNCITDLDTLKNHRGQHQRLSSIVSGVCLSTSAASIIAEEERGEGYTPRPHVGSFMSQGSFLFSEVASGATLSEKPTVEDTLSEADPPPGQKQPPQKEDIVEVIEEGSSIVAGTESATVSLGQHTPRGAKRSIAVARSVAAAQARHGGGGSPERTPPAVPPIAGFASSSPTPPRSPRNTFSPRGSRARVERGTLGGPAGPGPGPGPGPSPAEVKAEAKAADLTRQLAELKAQTAKPDILWEKLEKLDSRLNEWGNQLNTLSLELARNTVSMQQFTDIMPRFFDSIGAVGSRPSQILGGNGKVSPTPPRWSGASEVSTAAAPPPPPRLTLVSQVSTAAVRGSERDDHLYQAGIASAGNGPSTQAL